MPFVLTKPLRCEASARAARTSASPIKPSLINGRKVCAMPRAARLRAPGARLASPAALSRQGKLRVNWYVMPSPFSFRFRPRVFFFGFPLVVRKNSVPCVP
jgi:hypothetical protein